MLLGWLIGLGFRWAARVEAERVSKEYTERQMRMAVDIHDFVGRNLTGVLVRVDGATAEQRTDPAFLDELVHRIRTADATLREVTADLQREGTAQPFRTVGAVDALRAGAAELSAAGFEVERSSQADVLLAGLPISNYRADVRLTELGPNSCRISWVGEFDAGPVVGAVMQRFLHFVLGDFVRRLRRYAPTA